MDRVDKIVDIFRIHRTVCARFEHRFNNVDRVEQHIDDRFGNFQSIGTNFVEHIFDRMRKRCDFIHLYRRRSAFQRMRRAKDFVDRFVICRIVFYDQHIAFQIVYLLLGFGKKIFQQLFVVGIKIIAHTLYYIRKPI